MGSITAVFLVPANAVRIYKILYLSLGFKVVVLYLKTYSVFVEVVDDLKGFKSIPAETGNFKAYHPY